MLFAIAKANPDTFDALMLVAGILFLIGAVMSAVERVFYSTITYLGLFFLAIGFLFLT